MPFLTLSSGLWFLLIDTLC